MEENQGWSDGGFPVAGVSPVLKKYKVKVQISDRQAATPWILGQWQCQSYAASFQEEKTQRGQWQLQACHVAGLFS